MFLHLEDVYCSVNQYFASSQCMMLQNHAWVKDPLKIQDKWMDFSAVEFEKFSDAVIGSTLQLPA